MLLNSFDRTIASKLQRPIKSRSDPKHQYTSPRYTKKTYTTSEANYNLSTTTNAELAELAIKSLPPELSHGTCQIHAKCNACGSAFQFTVSNEPKTVKMPLTYCPYCALPSLVINPNTSTPVNYVERSIEEWRHLADIFIPFVPVIPSVTNPSGYEIESPESTLVRIADIRAKYTYWEKYGAQYRTFKDFMDHYAEVVANELNNPTTPRSTVPVNHSLKQKPKHKKIRFIIKPKAN